MANRRMISNSIVKSARFLKMPPTTQNLYFHLIMNADDDGVVEAFPIMRMVGATEDDLKILMDKTFVYLLNEDLVAYIDKWTEHNKVRAERKIDSLYKELLLRVVPNVEYRETRKKKDIGVIKNMSDKCQTNDGQMSAEDRLGKVRSGKDRSGHLHNELAAIQNFYEDNGFGTLSSKTRTDFSYWIEDFKKIGATEEDARELIILAMEKAVDYNARKYSYINSILRDWEQKKLITLEQVKAMENEREKANKQQRFNRENNKPDYSTWVSSGDDF